MPTVAIMQPYFYPYAGYFRLFTHADLFVVLDCVQFPRRGWVHRNRLTAADGNLNWLTLGLAYAPQQALIRDLQFAPDAADRLREDLRRFPALAAPQAAARLAELPLLDAQGSVVDYLETNLRAVLRTIGARCHMVRSSSLAIDPQLRAQARILEIAAQVGATRYLNAPGGAALYDAAAFAARGLELAFLDPWCGDGASMLERLCRDDPAVLRRELTAPSSAG